MKKAGKFLKDIVLSSSNIQFIRVEAYFYFSIPNYSNKLYLARFFAKYACRLKSVTASNILGRFVILWCGLFEEPPNLRTCKSFSRHVC
jgi:hypothetical protein